MNWTLEPATYACPEHPTVDLSKQVWLEVMSAGGILVGGAFAAPRYDVTMWGKARGLVSLRRRKVKSPEGPFTIRVNCPGIPGTKKDEDKPHRQTIRGVVR
jgi:hypothetical protein